MGYVEDLLEGLHALCTPNILILQYVNNTGCDNECKKIAISKTTPR